MPGVNQHKGDKDAGAFHAVGGSGHQVTGFLLVVKPEGKLLQAAEEGVTQVNCNPVRDGIGQIALPIGSDAPRQGNSSQQQNQHCQVATSSLLT